MLNQGAGGLSFNSDIDEDLEPETWESAFEKPTLIPAK